jgi:hypothetical protein
MLQQERWPYLKGEVWRETCVQKTSWEHGHSHLDAKEGGLEKTSPTHVHSPTL